MNKTRMIAAAQVKAAQKPIGVRGQIKGTGYKRWQVQIQVQTRTSCWMETHHVVNLAGQGYDRHHSKKPVVGRDLPRTPQSFSRTSRGDLWSSPMCSSSTTLLPVCNFWVRKLLRIFNEARHIGDAVYIFNTNLPNTALQLSRLTGQQGSQSWRPDPKPRPWQTRWCH